MNFIRFNRESPARKTDVLKLGVSGRFAINIVDNLIVVHHQASKVGLVTTDVGSRHKTHHTHL